MQKNPSLSNPNQNRNLNSGPAHNLQYQPPNLSTAAALAAANKFGANTDAAGTVLGDFSRNLNSSSLVNKMNQQGMMQHVANPITLQLAARRKAQASGIVGSSNETVVQTLGNAPFMNPMIPIEQQPIPLSFANEPIEIELTKEAEAEANSFFQKLLQGQCPPDEMFKTICEYATHGNASQRKLLDGILRMLADEVSRHLQDYPESMLPLIADLYGSVLAASAHLFSLRALSMLWRAVLARLHLLSPETPMDSPLFAAIIVILLRAKNTFTHFSNLPMCLTNCPVFKVFPPELQGYILASDLAIKNYLLSQQSGQANTKAPATLHQANYSGMDPLVHTGGTSNTLSLITQPPPLPIELNVKPPDPPEESVSDRISFIFNNVSRTNVKDKSTELAAILSEDRLLPWFAFYLVSKRVPIEHAFHDLFALVLDHIQDRVPNVRTKIMQELLRNIKLLLRSIRTDKDDMQSRGTLKNLGSFLGLITLARNKPVLHDDLNIKDLIYEAYHKGPVPTQYVVPFVARVVRGATESIVFRPPNPWTMGILKVLRELYDMHDVKDCLRFEIEILYRAFNFNLDDVPMAHFLRNLGHLANLEVQLCFLVTGPISSVSSVTTTSAVSSMDAGIYKTTCGPANDQLTTTTSSAALVPIAQQELTTQQQRQMLNMLAMLQKQQQASASLNQTSSTVDAASTGPQSLYSASGLDLASLVQSSFNQASSGGPNSNRQMVAALAAAAMQKQKQQQQQQLKTIGAAAAAGTSQLTSSGPAASSLMSFQHQQQQFVAAVAALQQQNQAQHQSQQTNLPQNAIQTMSQLSTTQIHPTNTTGSTEGILDSSGIVPFTYHLLRYEDVNIHSIWACLNLEELFNSVAAASNRAGSNAPTGAAAALAMIQANPRLRTLIEQAMTRAINELTIPVFERCARITVTTVATIIRKDFALDPDPSRMLFAARQMIRHLAAGMSLITAREALGMSLVTCLKNIILGEIHSASALEKEAVQYLAHMVVTKSMHACLAYMQKSVAEKAVKEVEKKLEPDLKIRSELGPRRFLEKATCQLAAQQANVPEQLRLTPGCPTASELAVYEEFGRAIPGFASTGSTTAITPLLSSLNLNSSAIGQSNSPVAAATAAAILQQQQQLTSAGRLQRQISSSVGASGTIVKPPTAYVNQTHNQQQALMLQPQTQYQAPLAILFDKIIGHIERCLTALSNCVPIANDPMCRSLRYLLDAMHLAKNTRDGNVASNVVTTIVQSFLEHYRPSVWPDQSRASEMLERFKEIHLFSLHQMHSPESPFSYAWVIRNVTYSWINLDGGRVIANSTGNSQVASSTTTTTTCMVLGSDSSTISTATTSEPHKEIDQKSQDKSVVDMLDTSSWSAWKTTQLTDSGSVDGRSCTIKWNWEAFAELIRAHLVYISQVDSYLAQEVTKGHPGAITFAIDLLDHFVLPCPPGTSVGAAAVAAASYTRPGINSGANQPTGSAPSASGPATSGVQPAKQFAILNEYDLWLTLDALRSRVACLNTSLSTSPSNVTDPVQLRLRLACARIRGLLDLGLIEHSPLFSATHPTIGALYTGCCQAHEYDDPPNLQEQVELFMRNWVEIYQGVRQRDITTIDSMLTQLTQIGVLPSLNTLTRFLRLATIFVIERALKQLRLQEQQLQSHQQQTLNSSWLPNSGASARITSYIELDAYARLISIIISRIGEQQQVAVLNKVLGLIAGSLLHEHEVRREGFHPMPFERILVMLFVELQPTPTPSLVPAGGLATGSDLKVDQGTGRTKPSTSEQNVPKPSDTSTATNDEARELGPLNLQQQLPLIFCHLLHCLRPGRATAFVFSWLEMLAHRSFVSRILSGPCPTKLRSAYQALYAQLLVDLLKFLGYFLQNAMMPKPIQCLYKATLRLLLVLIHDFPEFVSDYYALFCDVVPSNSIQMRNLILSALPKRSVPTADPLQAPPVDHLASLEDPTGYCMDAGSRLPEPMRCELDAYLTSRAPVKLLSELVTMLRRADDILPPLPPQFAFHPQQHARHQQALAAYAAALAANDTSSGVLSSSGFTKSDDKDNEDGSAVGASGQNAKKLVTKNIATAESWGNNPTSTTNSEISSTEMVHSSNRSTTGHMSSISGTSSAAAAALLWGVRAAQQVATFGLADNMHYNVELMTTLALYLCITAIRSLRDKGMPLNMSTIAHTPQMDIIQSLVLNLDNEGRYLLLNCMANQLRYPNSHTYYFSYTILYLFSEQSKEQVKEQISRVLMERLIVNRPHPWGLLMTSAELLRNPAYHFWEHEFARCNPEIENMVTVVANSCMPSFQIPTINPTLSSTSTTGSNHPSGMRNPTLSSYMAQGRPQGSPISRSGGNGMGSVIGSTVGGIGSNNIPSNSNPTPLLTE